MTQLLTTGKSSRLYSALVRDQRLAQSVVGYAFPIVTGAAMVVFWVTAAQGVSPDALEAAFWREMEAVAEKGCEQREIDRVITSTESRHLVSLQRVGERANEISMFTTLFGEPERINTEMDRIRSVTREGVTRFAGDYLNRDRAGVLVYLPVAARSDETSSAEATS